VWRERDIAEQRPATRPKIGHERLLAVPVNPQVPPVDSVVTENKVVVRQVADDQAVKPQLDDLSRPTVSGRGDNMGDSCRAWR
jgi:hypothetical protein